ncbi:MAG: sigma 54-interacting transcriptional regulator [Gammaproteobacteria bacterium]|nr:sigma 54-interacting transcriptional regulator [Gammaproteobacteria bacterium]
MAELENLAVSKGKVLVVDDDPDMLKLLSKWLENAGFDAVAVASGTEALRELSAARPDIVVTDLFMDEMDGMTLVTRIHEDNALTPVIMLSGQAQIPDAVKATHLGTSAFLTKPIDKDEFLNEIDRHIRSRRKGTGDLARNIIYRSDVMAELIEQAELLAQGDITVFISGATGTGKEVLARAIHDASPRREFPFIGVNCGAIPEQLLESELFGHEKGAFTGATTKHEGLFLAANGGTLFLDEIGDMPLDLQVKLLRVLQDFEIRPVGSTKTLPVNVRIISATHNDLEALVSNGEFREDLYYRLNVVPLMMPRLSERPDDVPMLLEHFLVAHAQKTKTRTKRFAPDATAYLSGASWPGNIRQLANAVELCVTLTKGDIIPLSMAQRALREEPVHIRTLKEAKAEFERKYLVSVLRVTEGNVVNAAKIAGRNRTEFYKLLNQHSLDAADFRVASKED